MSEVELDPKTLVDRLARYERLLEISQALVEERDFDRLLELISTTAREQLRADKCTLYILDQERHDLWVKVARDEVMTQHRFPMNKGIAGYVATTGQVVNLEDASTDPRFNPQMDLATGYRTRSMLAMPIRNRRNEIIGVFQAINPEEGPFTKDDEEFLRAFSSHAALALENARLYEEINLMNKRLQMENLYLKKEVEGKYQFDQLIGNSAGMGRVKELMEKVIDYPTTVLLTGETGTGKELVARIIHYNSPRREHKFVSINCGALPETLLESELFGHVKGSFTGAVADKKGLFEVAHQGTIFLDEVGDASPSTQVRLLRVLQEGEIQPVGSNTVRLVDVRVISATNRDLENEVEKGAFREDLFYRLSVFPIHLPPLRERAEDIPLLCHHFLGAYSHKLGKQVAGFSDAAVDTLRRYAFPGNIRELQNEIERAVTMASGRTIQVQDLSERVRRTGEKPLGWGEDGDLKARVQQIEVEAIEKALKTHGGNKTRAAQDLGISRVGLNKKMKRYGMME